jgi:hypothetical protein
MDILLQETLESYIGREDQLANDDVFKFYHLFINDPFIQTLHNIKHQVKNTGSDSDNGFYIHSYDTRGLSTLENHYLFDYSYRYNNFGYFYREYPNIYKLTTLLLYYYKDLKKVPTFYKRALSKEFFLCLSMYNKKVKHFGDDPFYFFMYIYAYYPVLKLMRFIHDSNVLRAYKESVYYGKELKGSRVIKASIDIKHQLSNEAKRINLPNSKKMLGLLDLERQHIKELLGAIPGD